MTRAADIDRTARAMKRGGGHYDFWSLAQVKESLRMGSLKPLQECFCPRCVALGRFLTRDYIRPPKRADRPAATGDRET